VCVTGVIVETNRVEIGARRRRKEEGGKNENLCVCDDIIEPQRMRENESCRVEDIH
jgi:hypothetical protein